MENLENHGSVEAPLLNEKTARANPEIPALTTSNIKLTLMIDYVFWVLVAIVLLRFAFKIIGANAQNAFVGLIYNLTNPVVGAFQGIVGDITSGNMIVEFSSLITVIILWLIYKAVLKLIAIIKVDAQK